MLMMIITCSVLGKDISKVKDTLAEDFGIIINLFYEYFMVLENSKKYHFLCIARDVGK